MTLLGIDKSPHTGIFRGHHDSQAAVSTAARPNLFKDSTDKHDSAAPGAVTVLIVEDDNGFRTGLETLLIDHGFDVVGTAADGEIGLELVKASRPNVVLMDLQLPRLSGVEVTRAIAEECAADCAVVILTVSADEADVVEALAAGASGYLVKGTSPETVAAGIRAAARGESLMSAEVASRVFARLRKNSVVPSPSDVPISFLSDREIDILRLLANGKRNEEIARELVISPFTVRNHISSLLQKLQVHNRTQAAAYAVRHGL
jgi:DNA-binding NarL/FixJ family response regulator